MAHTHPDAKKYHHLHNQGFENRIIFSSEEDYNRFEAYLYLLNSVESPRASNLLGKGRTTNVFESARGEKLVAIGAYSFTPREFQLLVTPLVEGGIAKFMQKLQTAYTMYFNFKYQRSGSLFHSAYRREDLESDTQVKYVHAAIHLAPTALFNSDWQNLSRDMLLKVVASAMRYRYSSVGEYGASKCIIVSPEYFPRSLGALKDDAALHVKVWEKLKPSLPVHL